MLYKRGGVWWYEFSIKGQRVRESTCSRSKVVAREAARHRRRGAGREHQRAEQAPEADAVLGGGQGLSRRSKRRSCRPSSYRIEQTSINHLTPTFGASPDLRYRRRQYRRLPAQAPGGRGCGQDGQSGDGYAPRHPQAQQAVGIRPGRRAGSCREHSEVGNGLDARARSRHSWKACSKSRSRSLYPAVALALNTGTPARRVAQPSVGSSRSACQDDPSRGDARRKPAPGASCP